MANTHDNQTPGFTPSTVYDFKLELQRLREMLNDVHYFLIEECSIQLAEVFVLPAVKKEDANMRQLGLNRLRKDEAPGFEIPLDAPFEVQWLSDEEARMKAFQHYSAMHAGIDESTRFSKRLPGLICVGTDRELDLVDRIERLNTQKDMLDSVISRLAKTPDERFEIVHQAEPGFMHAMATRHLVSVHAMPIISASFVWEHRNAIKSMTKQEVLTKIENSIEYGAKQRSTYETEQGFALHVQDELHRIGQYPDNATFRTIRPTPAVPVCKLRFDAPNPNEDSAEKTQRIAYVCHSPILAINTGAPERFKPLKNYPGRPPRDYGEPVIRRLHLYAKSHPSAYSKG